jgi:predicted transposase YdaD
MDIIKESPIIRELREEWIAKGREEGREEGKREAMLKALHQTLTIRFQVASGEFDKRLEELDLKLLEQLNEVALRVQTLAEFEQALADLLL